MDKYENSNLTNGSETFPLLTNQNPLLQTHSKETLTPFGRHLKLSSIYNQLVALDKWIQENTQCDETKKKIEADITFKKPMIVAPLQ